MTHEIDQLKSKGEYEAAGRLAFRTNAGKSYGCHFGMKSDRDAAVKEFERGYELEQRKPKIELKKVKVAASLSEETVAYTADVYVDGKLFAHASNHGHGGPDLFHPAKGFGVSDVVALEKLVKETYPKTEFFGKLLDESLEAICQGLAEQDRLKTNFRSKLSKHFVMEDGGKIYQAKKAKGREVEHLAKLKAAHPRARILNEMPFDAAWDVYYALAFVR